MNRLVITPNPSTDVLDSISHNDADRPTGHAGSRQVHGGDPANPIRIITSGGGRVLAKRTGEQIPEGAY